MRLSKREKEAKIVELYKSGWSYNQLQKRYKISPNYLAKLVKGIEVKCTTCGKYKGKVRFRTFHPDKINRPKYAITLCPSCHAKEELKSRRDNQNLSQTTVTNPPQLANKESNLSTTLPLYPVRPLSKTAKVVIGGGIVILTVKDVFPNFFNNLQHWLQPPDNSHKKPIMGLKKSTW